jgi:MFS transporter, DHA1 family, inner membrane transport protein
VPDSTARAADAPPPRLPIAILALAIGAFAIGATEFTIIGLLPQVADGVDVSIPRAGLLVSGYALGVLIGAPLMTAAGTRVPRHRLLLGLMGLFTVGNTLAAVAPNYELLLVSRVISALPHGAFFGVGAVVAAELAAPEQRNKAIAMMLSGLAVSNVIGVPLGTLLGQHLGWRSSFWAIAVLGLVSMAAIWRLVPAMSAGPSLRNELAAFRRPRVWLALSLIVFGFGGTFAIVGYITPLMTEEAGLSKSAVLPVLSVLGLGMVVGTRLVDVVTRGRTLLRVIATWLSLMIVVLLLFAVFASVAVVAIALVFLLGVVAFTVGTPMQALAMDEALEAPTLVSAAAQGAFNLGNALGPAAGGLTIGAGLGYASVGWVGAIIVLVGLGLAVVFARLGRAEVAAGPVAPSAGERPRRVDRAPTECDRA